MFQGKLDADGAAELQLTSGTVSITKDMVAIERVTRKVNGYSYTPSVIEPSFGIGRILYCMFEHTFYTREGDEQRTVFRLKPWVAPIKATVFPLLQRHELSDVAQTLSHALRRAGISSLIDITGARMSKSAESRASARLRRGALLVKVCAL